MGKHEKKSKKKSKKEKRERRSRSKSSSSEEEWVEKETKSADTRVKQESSNSRNERDEWMSLPSLFATSSNADRRKEREEAKQKQKVSDKYDPRNSVRELNPYWKSGGEGLPSLSNKTKFKRPDEDEDNTYTSYKSRSSRPNWRKCSPGSQDRVRDNSSSSSSNFNRERNDRDYQRERNWQHRQDDPKKSYRENKDRKNQTSTIIYTSEDHEEAPKRVEKEETPASSGMLTDKEMNDLGAKIVKAEILGNTALVKELKEKLDRAREEKQTTSLNVNNDEEGVLLFSTDSKGFSRPLNAPETEDKSIKKKRKMETHSDGQRFKYYPDDDKYDLKRMFEHEKFNSTAQQDAEFVKLTAKVKHMEDLDDIFMDKIRTEKAGDSEKKSDKERSKAIAEHNKMTKSLDNCHQCLQSDAMLKHLMISLGETVYLSLPPYEPLTDGHCLLIPIRHVTCSTQLDENEWTEVSDIRKALTKMFLSQDQDVIFYETVLNVNSYAHMVLHCVPVPKEHGDLAPIYFKKAIDECETEWSTNKKLINLAGKDVRRAVPKGLPYFFVSFGMTEGFAHVIEDQRYFSQFFAPEVIGGIMDLHHSKWRKQQNQKFALQKERVLAFSKEWGTFDCTVKK